MLTYCLWLTVNLTMLKTSLPHVTPLYQYDEMDATCMCSIEKQMRMHPHIRSGHELDFVLLCPLVVPLAFWNIGFDGHCEHLQSWLTESVSLTILKVWIMSVLCLLKFKVGSCNSFSLLLYGNPFVSGTSRVARR